MTRLLRSTKLAAGVVTGGLLIAASAFAATPDKGTISSSSPKVTWGGSITNSGVFYNAWAQDPSTDCSAPACDTFTLTAAVAGIAAGRAAARRSGRAAADRQAVEGVRAQDHQGAQVQDHRRDDGPPERRDGEAAQGQEDRRHRRADAPRGQEDARPQAR